MRKMKDSETTWLADIPSDWEITRIASLYSLRNQKVSDTEYEPLSVTNKGIMPQLETAAKSNAHDDRKLVKKGDFAINSRSDRRGSCGISDYDGSVSLINTILAPRNAMNPRYYNWLFHTTQFGDEFYCWGHGIVNDLWTTGWQDMKKILIPVPSLPEQEKIAAYLDSRCAEIDSLTADIQTQIDTLEQYKRSVITEAVTMGLNPDAEMKDSGVQWIGMMPSHWAVHPVYTYFGERKNNNRLGKEDNLLSLSYGRVIEKDINTSDGLLPESFNTYNIVEADDIIIRPTDLQNDKRSLRTGLVREHGIITSAYIDLMPIKQVDSRYFHYLLHALDVMKVFYNMGNGVRQGLNYSEFSRLMVFEPPYDEQVAIAEVLDAKVAEIDSIIEAKKEQLSVVDEYKKSLIFEYVTGKKEVAAS
ncbi:MAG TPA: restriction endonuclease subunit S [Lachnospiraceae bacterium]|nr:restriction endonuclease subunit S [Lachnospiraceae bacterium]